MPFGNEEEALDQLMAEAQVRAAQPDPRRDTLRASAERAVRTAPWTTVAATVVAGFIAGALWKV